MTDRDPARAETAPNSPAPSVLVVEDNRPNRILIEALLGALGCRAVLARGGEEAIQIASEDRFDVILMDIHMPRLDGIETMRRLRAGSGPNARTPVLALTANVHAGDHAAFATAGVAAILVKPVTASTLAAAIETWAGPIGSRQPAA